MENPTQLQLLQAVIFFSAGIAVGVVYDVCRAIRRCSGRRVQSAVDVVFVCCAAALLFVLGMLVGDGQLRIFMLGSLTAGAVGYSLLCSRYVVPVLCKWMRLLRRLVGFALIPVRRAKKFIKLRKNLFPKWTAWFKINGYSFNIRHRVFRRTQKGEAAAYAGEKDRMDDLHRDRSNGGVRSVEYCGGTAPADPGRGIPHGIAGGGQSVDAGK